MPDREEILIYLSTNKSRLMKQYHLIRIGIFGSYSRGEQTPQSDLDLLVEFEKNTSDLSRLKQEIRDEFQSKFNISVDICREKYIKSIFRDQILSEVKYA